jgi:hypothetical protein
MQLEALKSSPEGLAALAAVKEAKMLKAMKKVARQKKRLLQELGRPDRPTGPFSLYFKQNFEAEKAKYPNKDMKVQDVVKALSLSWSTISDAEKAPFQVKFAI